MVLRRTVRVPNCLWAAVAERGRAVAVTAPRLPAHLGQCGAERGELSALLGQRCLRLQRLYLCGQLVPLHLARLMSRVSSNRRCCRRSIEPNMCRLTLELFVAALQCFVGCAQANHLRL